jgi:hypothetical protein
MTPAMQDRDPAAHLVVAGTGRAGTSFLVRYLTELGLDTHLARHGQRDSWDDDANAGLETVPLSHQSWDLPYVVKYPWLYQCIDHILADSAMRLDGVIIPVRDLGEAAISRTLVELQSMYRSLPWMAELDQSWEVWGHTPGGLTYSLNPLDQGRLLAVGFHHLIERLIRADIPVVLLAFPRLVNDPQYLFRKLQPFLPTAVGEITAIQAHMRVCDPTKVRVRGELDAAAISDAPSVSEATRYVPHGRLDAIAVRRELARVRRMMADAETTTRQSEQQTASAQAMAAAARDDAERARAETARARDDAGRAQAETARARDDAGRAQAEMRVASEASARADEETRELRRRLAQTEQSLQAEAEYREREVTALRGQVTAAQMDAARLRQDLKVVYSSRSWRLTSGYRAIGLAIQIARRRRL